VTSPSARPTVLLAAALPLLAACARDAPGARLVVLYATCSLSRDAIEPYDPAVATTPNLAAFAKEARVMERHVTEEGQSGIAYASLFSGCQADRHGAFRHPVPLGDELTLIGEAFRDAGYETYFWNGHPMGSLALNYGQGIQHGFETSWDDPDAYTANDARFAELVARLAADPGARAFVLVNFTVSHSPYNRFAPLAEILAFLRAHPELGQGLSSADVRRGLELYDSRHRLPLQWDYRATVAELGLAPEQEEKLQRVLALAYRTCVARLDGWFGRFLAAIDGAGLREDSVVAFTADHGEILFRDNALFHWTHGLQLVREDLLVPWIVRAPGVGVAPGRHASVTRSIDVFPTLAGLCGVPVPEGAVEGRDLARALRGEAPPSAELAFSHGSLIGANLLERAFEGFELLRFFPDADDIDDVWVRVQAGDMAYRYRNLDGTNWGLEVHDLARDPEERENLYDPDDAAHQAMLAQLLAYKQRLKEGFARTWASGEKAAELDELKDLGYIR
jgi:arylsulfatase A-like enzyme